MKEFTIEEIVEEMVRTLRTECPALPEGTWRPMGERLKARLDELGTTAGFTVWMEPGRGEYLWDVAWTYEPDDADRYSLELAAEIEISDWKAELIAEDFYKLVDAKARLKVFVAASTLDGGST